MLRKNASYMDNMFKIREMSRDELSLAIAWAKEEGWNPGTTDFDSFYAADPHGFLMGYEGEEPIGCISAVRYGSTFGFIGLYYVKPHFRKQLFGYYLGRAGLKRLEGRTIGIDGLLDRLDGYQRMGFRLAFKNYRYKGKGGVYGQSNRYVKPLTEVPFIHVAEYDAPFFPDDRRGFLKSWICQEGTRAYGYVNRGKMEGYGVIRPCFEGYKIGPLFADTPFVADALFSALVSEIPYDTLFFLDLPDKNSAAARLAEKYGMKPAFRTARMFKGSIPELPLERMYGMTSLELG